MNYLKKVVYFPIKLVSRQIKKLAPIFNLFYRESLYEWYSHQLVKSAEDKQIFFITRRDLGPFLINCNYCTNWQLLRGPICIVILTTDYQRDLDILKLTLPDAKVICFDSPFFRRWIRFFGVKNTHFKTLAHIYAKLTCDFPNGIILFEQMLKQNGFHRSNYIPQFDPSLALPELDKNPDFKRTYQTFCTYYDCRLQFYYDCFSLHYERNLEKPFYELPKSQALLKKLKIDRPYVMININCRNYFNKSPIAIGERRPIQLPLRYNVLVDRLIEKGYFVVLQGREEQPRLAPRKHFFDYSKSDFCSLENDVLLFASCAFAISSKNGPDYFPTLCNVPVLGLNYTELSAMNFNLKMRFFPKHIQNLDTGAYLTWKELLASPIFFDIGTTIYSDRIRYEEMSEEELLLALDEFIPLTQAPFTIWEDYTDHQKEFKSYLNPAHLDLYQIKGVPCHCYLSNQRRF